MVPLHIVNIDVSDTEGFTSEIEFRELLTACQEHLDALQGAIDTKTSAVAYFPPNEGCQNAKGWSARYILMFSVGQKRIEPLMHLTDLVASYIQATLPLHIDVQVHVSKFGFP